MMGEMGANFYGFELRNGRIVQTHADSILEAMDIVQREHGSPVWRGRQLDGFDNDAPAGRPPYLIRRQRPLDGWAK